MGRKSLDRERKNITTKTTRWLGDLLVGLQFENLEALTMDDIARIAGKSKSTIYEYFQSKEEILQAACQTRTLFLSEAILDIGKKELATVELYEQLMEVFADGTAGISLTFLQNVKELYPDTWILIDEFIDSFVGLLKEHYQIGIDEGIYNPVSIELLGNIDKLFVVQVVTNPTIFSDEKYTISELVRDYLNLRLMGLLKR